MQGVFFRDSVRREADGRELAGWVRNRADGTVEAVFEGSSDAVDALIEFCRGDPGQARVKEVEVAEEEPEGLAGFEVR